MLTLPQIQQKLEIFRRLSKTAILYCFFNMISFINLCVTHICSFMTRKNILQTLFYLCLFLGPVLQAKGDLPLRFVAIQNPKNLVKTYDIIKDQRGYIWAGTSNGLVRYDGYNFRSYPFDNKTISHMLYLPEWEDIIICDNSGLSIFSIKEETFYTIDQFAGEQVNSAILINETVYVTYETGMKYFKLPEDGNFKQISVISDKMQFTDYQTYKSRSLDGKLYICVKGGILERSVNGNYKFHSTSFDVNGKNEFVLDFCQDKFDSSILWVGTESGLIKYSLDSGIIDIFLKGIPVNCFHYKNDQLMIGTGYGLFLKDLDDNFLQYRHEADHLTSLPANVVLNIYERNPNELYLSTDHGIVQVDLSDHWTHHKINATMNSSEGMDVSVLNIDQDYNIFIGGNNGLIVTDSSFNYKNRYYADKGPVNKRLSHNRIRYLLNDYKSIWVASDGGIDYINLVNNSVTKCNLKIAGKEIPTNWTYSLAKDNHGRMWAGSYNGLYCIPGIDKVVRKRNAQAEATAFLQGLNVNSLFVQSNKLYALADIIYVIDLDNLYVDRIESEGQGYLHSLTGNDNTIWFAKSNTLYTLDGNRKVIPFKVFSSMIKKVEYCDSQLYILLDKSIAIYDIKSETWNNQTLHKNDILTMSTAKDFPVLFGCIDQVFEFNPSEIRPLQIKSGPVLTDLIIKNNSIRPNVAYEGEVILKQDINFVKEIFLKNSQNSFVIEFSALDLISQDKVYAYRLKGFDDEFHRTTKNNATFINIPAGNYNFEVCTLGPDGQVDSTMTKLDININPVFYKSLTAYVIYTIIILSILIFIAKFFKTSQKLKIEHLEKENAMKLVKLKTDFLSNISHEIKNPLSMILGPVGKLINQESDVLVTNELSNIRKNAERIHFLLDKMMDYNEKTENKLFFPSAASIQVLAKECFDNFKDDFNAKSISAKFISDEIKYIFMIDRVQMQSVFQNLLSNAIKFTPNGGNVLMSINILEDTSEILKVGICITDTGCGIKKEEIPFIFNRYYMAPSNKDKNSNGTGIGLYLVKNIIEKHNGNILVESEQGKGTTFKIILSTLKTDSFLIQPENNGLQQQTLHNLSNVWKHNRKPRILLVEDNQDIREFITASLEKDYNIIPVVDGLDGLSVLEKDNIDLIITDIAMPRMDGLTMSKNIRSSIQTAFIPIIILSGNIDSETRLKGYEYADILISKPFSLSYLNSSIIQLLVKHEHYLAKLHEHETLSVKVEEVESPDEIFLKEIIAVIDNHINDAEFNTNQLYKETHYSSDKIYRKIKQLCGMTIVEFIRDIRLKKAALYLKQGKLSVTEVMYMVGFTTASYFSKCFKEKYGVTPSEYIKTSQK